MVIDIGIDPSPSICTREPERNHGASHSAAPLGIGGVMPDTGAAAGSAAAAEAWAHATFTPPISNNANSTDFIAIPRPHGQGAVGSGQRQLGMAPVFTRNRWRANDPFPGRDGPEAPKPQGGQVARANIARPRTLAGPGGSGAAR
ncbi:hypothetical protein GCM10009080_29830 [Cupriavidus pauculus]